MGLELRFFSFKINALVAWKVGFQTVLAVWAKYFQKIIDKCLYIELNMLAASLQVRRRTATLSQVVYNIVIMVMSVWIFILIYLFHCDSFARFGRVYVFYYMHCLIFIY